MICLFCFKNILKIFFIESNKLTDLFFLNYCKNKDLIIRNYFIRIKFIYQAIVSVMRGFIILTTFSLRLSFEIEVFFASEIAKMTKI